MAAPLAVISTALPSKRFWKGFRLSMTQFPDETAAPTLFAHTLRKEWGVGILSGENQGKRSYLFENGAERTLASGFHELMREVEQPNAEQQMIGARLHAVLLSRGDAKPAAAVKTSGPSFAEQLGTLRRIYPGGLADPKWVAEVRGRRDEAIERARTELSAEALDSLLGEERFEEVWALVRATVNGADIAPNSARISNKKQITPPAALAGAVRELLYGAAPDEQRFDRYLAAFAAAFGRSASWETATALLALVHPKQHVCVAPTAFRKQLKALSPRGAIASQPNGSDYARLLGVGRVILGKLAENGEAPRDLFDAYDFICLTLRPAAKKAPSPSGQTKTA
jgi:hypothetical protein